jgi:hypothetical protein
VDLRRINFVVGASASGLLAAAILPTALAAADDYVYLPDQSKFVPEPPSVTGFETSPISLPPLFDQETGYEVFRAIDITAAGTSGPDAMAGPVLITNLFGTTETQFDDAFTYSNPVPVPGGLDEGSQITLWQLPFGFGNELIFSSSVPLGLEDIVITPFGDLPF